METQLLPTGTQTGTPTVAPVAPLAWDFDHLSLVPRVVSSLLHRMDAEPEARLGDVRLSVPMLASPMPDVCGREMCQAMASEGALGVLQRFGTVEDQVADFRAALGSMRGEGRRIAAAVGVTGDYRSRCAALHDAGCRIVCLDTANGAHLQTQQALAWVKRTYPDVFVIAGNVASAEGFRWLEEQGADAVRVGIAGGSVCETRTETGVYVPTLYAVAEAVQVRSRALIIGDSGIRTPSDVCKLLAVGADLVMVGSALAGTRESPGRVIVVDGKKFKIMRGAASFSVQQQARGEDPAYVEGAETMVAYKGSVRDVIHRYLAGLRSSMSYMNARTLSEYRANARFVRLV